MAETINWHDTSSSLFLNPHLPETTKHSLKTIFNSHTYLKAHVWLSSSGTESFPKLIALSKQAMLASAAAVNAHLAIQSHHAWLNVLPLYHTGGLAIHARAFLSRSPLFDFSDHKWDPHAFVKQLGNLQIAFSSLTPTHVYDLVKNALRPPKSLKAIIIGGAPFPQALHMQAHALGWPCLKSYGMTELCSQIATSLSGDPLAPPVVLPHIELRFTSDAFIEVKSPALLSGFVRGNDPQQTFIDPKEDGWYITQDKGVLVEGVLHLHGRGSNFIKIGGENINFSDLEALWEKLKTQWHPDKDSALIDLPDERLGSIICLAITAPSETPIFSLMMEAFNKQTLPIAKIRKIYFVDKIPRTALFKLQKDELRKKCPY